MLSTQPTKILTTALLSAPLLFALACETPPAEGSDDVVADDTLGSDGMMDDSVGTDETSTEAGTETDTETTTGSDECAGYRSEYPVGPYGLTVGSVLADVPGMVRGDGTPVSFLDVYQDTSKVALVVVNAFDT